MIGRFRRAGSLALALLCTGAAWTTGLRAQEAPVAPASSSGTDTLGLKQVIDMAMSRNRDVKVARAGLDEARGRVDEAWGNVYPSVDFSASYTRNVSPQVSFLPARIFDPTAPEGEFTPIQFGADNSWQSSITLEQPIFDPRAFVGVGSAAEYKGLQEESTRGTLQDVVTRVRTEYFNLLLAQERVRLSEQSLDRVRKSLDETRAMNKAGLSSDYDVLRLQVELANLEPALRQSRNAVASARRALAVDLALKDPSTLRVRGSLAALDLEHPGQNSAANRELLTLTGVKGAGASDGEALVREAESRRSDIRQAEANADLRHTQMRLEQVDYLPKISLFGSYNIQAQQNGKPDFFGSNQNRAYSRMVGLRVSVPLFTGLKRQAQIDESRATYRQAETRARLTRDRARSQVLDLSDAVNEARQRARGQGLAVKQARRGYSIASAEYREGVSGQLELTDAEVALRQSQFNYAQAVYDYLVARARLDQAVGRVPMVDDPRQ